MLIKTVCFCKKFEEVVRGRVSEVLKHFEQKKIKGEVV